MQAEPKSEKVIYTCKNDVSVAAFKTFSIQLMRFEYVGFRNISFNVCSIYFIQIIFYGVFDVHVQQPDKHVERYYTFRNFLAINENWDAANESIHFSKKLPIKFDNRRTDNVFDLYHCIIMKLLCMSTKMIHYNYITAF